MEPGGPYAEPEKPPTEPFSVPDGPGWNPDAKEEQAKPEQKKPEKPAPVKMKYRVVERDDEPGDERQDEPSVPGFGDAGQFVVTTEFGLGISSSRWDSSDASSFGTTVSPALDYFFVRNISLGVEANFLTQAARGYGADGSLQEGRYLLVSGGVHVGVNVRFNRWLSLYPRLMIGLHRVERTEELVRGSVSSFLPYGTGSVSQTRAGVWGSLEAPLLFHVAPHFFLGLGPHVYHDFSDVQGGATVGALVTSFGASLIAGGYFGGLETKAGTPEPNRRRFGDRGTVALIGESASVQWTKYSQTDSLGTSFTFSPGADWFAADHVSVGFGLAFSKFDGLGFDAAGRRVSNEVTFVGATIRAGFDIRTVSWLSFYPRFIVGTGTRRQSQNNGFDSSTTKASIDWGSVSLLALIHPAEHFFIGFGPYASHDLRHSYERTSYQNRNTTIGAGTVVGGWL